MDDVDRLICAAIADMRWLVVRYGDAERVVQPHVYGDDANGVRLLSAFQQTGGSASGAATGWKSFRKDRMTAITPCDERFHAPRADYRHADGAFAHILCQLD